jgi:ATP-dependent Clp protease ATP-binding subunit ClpC
MECDIGVFDDLLASIGADRVRICSMIRSIVGEGIDDARVPKLPQSPNAKKAIQFAMEEASSLRHRYIGTEHLLLGMLCGDDGVAARVLVQLGVELEAVRERVRVDHLTQVLLEIERQTIDAED